MARAAAEATRGLAVLDLDVPLSAAGRIQRQTRIVHFVRVAIALVVVANLGRIPILFVGNKDAPILVTDLGIIAVLAAAAFLALQKRSLQIDVVARDALL